MNIDDLDGLESLVGGMDEQKLVQLYDQLDDEKVHQGLRQMVETYVGPHFEDIRESVAEYPDAQKVRETYKAQPEHKQEEIFDGAVQDLIVLSAEIRERPKDGMMRLKGYLRDPTVLEALLLIFEDCDDEQTAERMKDFAATQFHLIGVMIAPEMYRKHEVEAALDLMNISQQRREAVLRDYRAQQR